jgi:hypothetical protein
MCWIIKFVRTTIYFDNEVALLQSDDGGIDFLASDQMNAQRNVEEELSLNRQIKQICSYQAKNDVAPKNASSMVA